MERADPAPRRVLRRLRLRLHHPGDIPRRDGARRIPGSRGVRMVVAPLRRRRRGEHLRGRRFAREPPGSRGVDGGTRRDGARRHDSPGGAGPRGHHRLGTAGGRNLQGGDDGGDAGGAAGGRPRGGAPHRGDDLVLRRGPGGRGRRGEPPGRGRPRLHARPRHRRRRPRGERVRIGPPTPPAEDSMIDRMPPLDEAKMKDSQKKAAAALIAGPRKAVVGPFIALLRSPELLERLQRVGEYLRFDNTIPQRLNELAILSVPRHVRNDLEWVIHHPFEIVAHVARDAEDRELVQSLRDRIVEAQVLAHALQALEELGAAQERDEWAHHRLARPGDERRRRFLLGILHLRFVERRHAIDHGILGWRGGRANANALATRAAPAMTRPGVKPRPPAARRLTTAGPTTLPAAKGEVIAAMRRRAAGPATRRASFIPAIVTTMKGPPTSSAEAMMPARPGTPRGIVTPSAITPCPPVHTARSGRLPRKAAAARVLAAAAAPKRGHDHPYTAGSGNASRAIAARNVAGMM